MHKVRDIGTRSTKWDVSIRLLLAGLRELCRGGCEKILRASEDGLHHGKCLSDTGGLMHTGAHRDYGGMYRKCTGTRQMRSV